MPQELRTPYCTVDVIIERGNGVILIKRKYPPFGWAIPGGYVEYGESLEQAVIREAKEETGLDIAITRQFHTYSDPGRDPRQHNISTVYIATGSGEPEAGDDAKELEVFSRDSLPADIVFDHRQILEDYYCGKY